MFCKYCGKETPEGRDVCEACASERADKQTPNEFYNAPCCENKQENAPVGGRMLGFGGALASAIVGVVGTIISVFALYFMMIHLVMNGVLDNVIEDPIISEMGLSLLLGLGITFLVVGVALGIVALVFGLKAIRCFIDVKRKGGVKPIATLILGIVGVDGAASVVIMTFVTALMGVIGAIIGATLGTVL